MALSFIIHGMCVASEVLGDERTDGWLGVELGQVCQVLIKLI